MDNQVYLQEKDTSESNRSINKLRFTIHNMINLRDCVFVICPKLNYDFHKEYQLTKSYYKKLLKHEQLSSKQKQLLE